MTMAWRKTIERWNRMNRTRKRELDGQTAPSLNDESLFYQTLLGTWPLEEMDSAAAAAYRERIEAYLIKAAREAKLRTSWANVNTEYEDALTQFVRATLETREGNLFLTDLVAVQGRLTRFGLYNALSQILCKLTAPGVPDIYQGNEIWDFSLVDPDNRRPVDYDKRRQLLAQIQEVWAERTARVSETDGTAARAAEWVRELLNSIGDGRAKLYLTWQVLQFRRAHPELFCSGEYIPLRVSGEHASNLCAYARRHDGGLLVALAPRLYLRLLGERTVPPLGEEVWENTLIELPRGFDSGGQPLRNVLDGTQVAPVIQGERPTVRAAAALAHFPVGLLHWTGQG
jgi:(1->4)-alpha-D-glucan 1-alpha-D-glucosylmutase